MGNIGNLLGRYGSADGNGTAPRRHVSWGFRLGVAACVAVVGSILLLSTMGSFTGYANQGYSSVVYNGNPLGNNNYRSFVTGGTGRFYKGFLSRQYEYPATNRNYIISRVAHEGDVKQADLLTAKCGDSNEVQVECALSFRLLADEEHLRKFHETYGIKFQAWTAEGWAEFLTQMVRQPIKESLQRQLKPYTAISAMGQSTDTSTGVTTGMLAIANEVQSDLQKQLDIFMGGHFVEVIAFQINDISPSNQDISNAIARRTAAQQDVETAKQKRDADYITAQGNERLAESLQNKGGMAAVAMEAVKSGKVTFWVLDGNSVNIAGPSK